MVDETAAGVGDPPPPGAAPRRRRALVRVLLLGLCWLAYLATPPYVTNDTQATIPVAISLLDDGDIEIGETQADPWQPLAVEVGTRRYPSYPWGPGVTAVPFVAVFRLMLREERVGRPLFTWLVGDPVRDDAGRIDERASLITHRYEVERFVASTWCVLALAVLWGVLRRRHGERLAAALVLAVAFGTASWTTGSRALWQHGPGVLCSTIAFWALLTAGERRGRLALAGLFVALAYTLRPTNAVVVLCCTAYVALRHTRRLPAYLGSAAAVAVVWCGVNLSTYGALLQPYYDGGQMLDFGLSFDAMAGLLVSPARGLFVYSPVYLLVLVTPFWQLRARVRMAPLDLLAWAVILLHLVTLSLWGEWWGGHTYGARMMSDLQPFLAWVVLPAGLAAARPAARRVLLAAFAVLALAGVAVNARYLDARARGWDTDPISVSFVPGRCWEWRDAPFLRGTRFDGRHEPLSVAGDELAFRGIGPIPGIATPIPLELRPGRYALIAELSRCEGTTAGIRWRVEAATGGALATLADETAVPVDGAHAFETAFALDAAARLVVRLHAVDEQQGRFRVRLRIERRG